VKAIAGADVEVGMIVAVAPGQDPFEVTRIENRASDPIHNDFRYVYGTPDRVPAVVWDDHWYALVER